ncbi:MAG: response regulator [Phycisphaerae bacterium]
MIPENPDTPFRILDVCPCSFDHADMRGLISGICTAAVQQVRTGAEALEKLKTQSYHLVLINRTLDGPMDGLSLLAAIRAQTSPPPAMLISNYADAQAKARPLGALPGFGRAQMHAALPIERLRQALGLDKADASIP